MTRRTVNGVRRGDWGPEVTITTARKVAQCTACARHIEIGEQAQVRSFVGTYSCVGCPAPSRALPKLPARVPCTCGLARCLECAWEAAMQATVVES